MTTKPSRRTARSDRRRQLLAAATWVFARKGYRAAGVSDIVHRAGVARGTFYLYFESKPRIFVAIVEDFQDRIRQLTDEPEPPIPLAEHNGRAMLQRSLRRWLELFAVHRDAAEVVLKEATAIDPRFEVAVVRLRELAIDYFAGRFRRFQALGFVNPATSPELAAHLQMGMVDEVVRTYILRRTSVDVAALAAELASFEWNGIRPDR